MAIVIGFIFVILALLGFSRWFHEFLFVIKGLLPLILFTSGVLAIVVGIASFGFRRGDGKS